MPPADCNNRSRKHKNRLPKCRVLSTPRAKAFSFSFFHPLLPSSRRQVKGTSFSFFCLLASISLRIPWDEPVFRLPFCGPLALTLGSSSHLVKKAHQES